MLSLMGCRADWPAACVIDSLPRSIERIRDREPDCCKPVIARQIDRGAGRHDDVDQHRQSQGIEHVESDSQATLLGEPHEDLRARRPLCHATSSRAVVRASDEYQAPIAGEENRESPNRARARR